MTGREGFYLKAVAGRHLAKSASDLTVAHQAITHAIEILKLEREIRPNVLHNDTRFQYELCCINVAAYMFEKFLNDKPNFYETYRFVQIQIRALKENQSELKTC